jgi:hypothetical protein
VVWAQAAGVVRVARLPAGAAGFEPAQTVSAASAQANRPAPGVGAGGTAVVVFEDQSGGQRIQRAAVRNGAGGSFAAATPISVAFSGFGSSAAGEPVTDVAVSAAGDAAVTWSGQVGAIFQVEATFRPASSARSSGAAPTTAARARSRCSKRSRPPRWSAKKSRSFRAGRRLELRVTAPGFIGKVVRYKLKKGNIPSGRQLCLPPGKKKPRKC